MSGEWEGTFTYPGGDATTPFSARIVETAGRFAGSIIEPDMYAPANPITAEIVGNRDTRSVDFTKIYIDPEEGYENPVDYVGQLSPDGLTVSGIWSLLDMNGTFEMYRDAGLAELEEAETAETVPASSERP